MHDAKQLTQKLKQYKPGDIQFQVEDDYILDALGMRDERSVSISHKTSLT